MRITVERLQAISRYAKNHTMLEAVKKFNCKHATVRRALMMDFPEHAPETSEIKPRKVSASGWSKSKADWVPPSLAAGQHDRFIGRAVN